ncbi:MAG: hypothetical protein KGP01_00190 [Actinomycetales bacterium]|nr:hypothetical protein [Actinomycetales bacterium]
MRTYKMRSGRVTSSQRAALDGVASRYDVGGWEWGRIHDRAAGREMVLDIGFGFGDSMLHYAAVEPDRFLIGLEVHIPGVGALCRDAAAAGLENMCVANVDARAWLASTAPPSALAGVRLFFPDPWQKKRHHKRRFIRRPVLDLLAGKCRPGAFLHIATDWADYADDAAAELDSSPAWDLQPGIDHRRGRPVTRFERRALADGRPVVDLVALRV